MLNLVLTKLYCYSKHVSHKYSEEDNMIFENVALLKNNALQAEKCRTSMKNLEHNTDVAKSIAVYVRYIKETLAYTIVIENAI